MKKGFILFINNSEATVKGYNSVNITMATHDRFMLYKQKNRENFKEYKI